MCKLHVCGGLYGLLSSFMCNENVPLKHLIPMNTSLNFQCNCCVISALDILSASCWGPGMKYILLLMLLLISGLSLLLEFGILVVFISP